ncbi:LysR family transcriptional regulator [Ramlibacter sp. AN1015]|uniref:LysR family transcriptional regulator n=1 Tax=Ramlibacter sp. AN1015 TaxID=3133428 RepID=UPI0030BB20EA
MNVTLKQLRAFVAVAHAQSFTGAAAQLHVTQSTLTASIQILEGEIGMRLFDRSTRAVQLTAQGQQFLPAAQRLLRELQQALDDMRQTADLQRGTVAVAAAASFIDYVLSAAVADMAHSYPGIRVRLTEATTDDACAMVLDGEVDFAVTTLVERPALLDAALVLTDTYGSVQHAEHPLSAETGPMRWSRLAPHVMVALPKASGIRALVDQQPQIADRLKQPAYEVASMSSLSPLLARGFGYAVLPALAAQPLVEDGLRFVPLREPVLRRSLFVFKKRGRALTPAAQALLEKTCGALQALATARHVKLYLDEAAVRVFAQPGRPTA